MWCLSTLKQYSILHLRSWAIDLYFCVAPTRGNPRARAPEFRMQETFVHGTLLSSTNEDGTGWQRFLMDLIKTIRFSLSSHAWFSFGLLGWLVVGPERFANLQPLRVSPRSQTHSNEDWMCWRWWTSPQLSALAQWLVWADTLLASQRSEHLNTCRYNREVRFGNSFQVWYISQPLLGREYRHT